MTIEGSGVITGVRVSHDRASVDEIAAAGADNQRAEVACLLAREGVEEAFALHTCNRVEAYVVTDDPTTGREAFSDFAPDVREDAVVYMDHETALRHLMRVAAGLESLVLGEDQVIGQVRDAYEDARSVGGIGPMLEEAVTKAIHVGERARTETELNEGIVSLGSAAAELAADELPIEEATALVLGAGRMGTLAARSLAERDVDRVLVANRTVSRAEELVEELDIAADALPIDDLGEPIDRADLIVGTTASSTHLVGRSDLASAGETLVIDIAQPRDVAPAVEALECVIRYDLDDLETITERTRERRREVAGEVEAMIDREFEHLLARFKRKRADEVIAAMYEGAEAIKSAELERAVAELESEGELTDAQREAVEAMADALVNKLLAAPTRSLRDAAERDDWTTIHTALRLFGPGLDGAVQDVEGDAPGEMGAAFDD